MRQRGFSLLEMLVAIAILGIALGVIYQAASGATRNVGADERYAYAVELAQSLLVMHASVPRQGVNDTGETPGGFSWRVYTEERALDLRKPVSLHDIQVDVAWEDGARSRSVTLNSVVEARRQ